MKATEGQSKVSSLDGEGEGNGEGGSDNEGDGNGEADGFGKLRRGFTQVLEGKTMVWIELKPGV
jgi:hypothetical protein